MQSYRREIDGLRAVAILPVLLFHFDIPGLSGGFVGVDIFFVISGFLIGGILWDELCRTGRIDLIRFYQRRIRRLAPVYFAVITACLIVGWAIMLPFDFRALGKEIISSSVYLSNVYFFTQAGYFDSVAKEKILLHTWSLSVEEQFYIFLPLVMIVLASVRRWLPMVLCLLGLGSLVACILLTPISQTAAFYLFPFRAWELLAGVLLAIMGHKRGLSWDLHPLLSWAGLALMAVGILTLDADQRFPGWRALLPVVGAVLVIANGRNPNGVNTLLRSRALVFIGLISYSLYLWHWPLATLWTYYFGSLGPLWQRLVLIMLSLALATLSWRFIETPTRRAQLSVRGLFLGTGLATGTALAAGAVIYLGDGLARRFPPQILTHIQATQDFNQDWQRCSVPQTGDLAGVELCPIGPEGEPRILIWGDSHVRAFKEGLEQAAFDGDVPALVIWRAGCPPLFGLEKTENSTTQAQDAACSDANRRIRDALEGSDRFDTVLLVGRWTYYTEGAGIGLDAHNTISVTGTGQAALSQSQLMQRAMTDTVARLRQSGRQVFILRQVPEIPTYDSRIVSRKLAHSGLAEAEVAEIASVPRAAIASRNSNADAMLTASGAALLDPWPLVCDDQTCSAMAGGFAGYFDNNHITNTNAIRLRELFLPVFRAEGG